MKISVACEVIDDEGHKLSLSHPAQRIVSLSPDLTEILCVVGAGKEIVARDSASDYPEAVKNIPAIANYQLLNQESLIALHPDLIVVWKASPWLYKLTQLPFPVYVSDPKHLLDIPRTIKNMGCLTGRELQASSQADAFTARYFQLKKQFSKEKNKSVFFQISDKPLITVTKQSWINEAIELCGEKNIFANLKGVAPIVNQEAVLQKNPDVVLGYGTSMWLGWESLNAVKQHAVYEFKTDDIERPGPRVLDGVGRLCRLFS